MIGAARGRGLDARLMDAAQLKFAEAFDAAFSNATLHWVLDKERAARAIWFALKPGGRFAGEMGGEGNLARLREALDDELVARGYRPADLCRQLVSDASRNSSPSMRAAGFKDIDARLIERPTPLEHGVAAWVADLPRRLARPRRRARTTSASPSPTRSPTASAPTSPTMSVSASS